jgi:serine/threonine-protein kinase
LLQGRSIDLLIANTYRVGERLGSGGMGEVREAEHVRLGLPVAIKFLRGQALTEPRAAERFRHEARRAATVRSENVVKVFDYGELEDGTPYLVMERLFGEDLRSLLEREGALPVRRAVKLAIDACHGLAAVHATGLVHRDLKPANLFIEHLQGGKERCVILDFGVAKAVAHDTTRPGALVGTVRYMAPEQIENSARVTPSSDIYALGAILYEALTGVSAHAGATLEETMFDIIHRDARSPSAFRALPQPLEAAVLRMLDRVPANRFASIDDAVRALTPFGALEEPTGAPDPTGEATLRESDDDRARTHSRMRASRPARTAAALAAACLVGIAGGWSAGSRERPPSVRARVAPSHPTAAANVLPSTQNVPAASPTPSASDLPRPSEPSPRTRPSSTRPNHAPSNARAPKQTETRLPGDFDPKDPYE